MFYALIWLPTLLLVGLWSLTAWALHGLAAWAVSSAGALGGGMSGWEGPLLPDALAVWLPAEVVQALGAMLNSLAPYLESLLQAMPSLSGVLAVAAWGLWGVGTVVLLMVGAGLHLAVALWRRRRITAAVPTRQALPAA